MGKDELADAETYELVPEIAPARKAETGGAPAGRPGGANAPHALRYRAPVEDLPRESEEDRIRDFHMPLWLLAGGTVIEVAAAVIKGRGRVVESVTEVGIGLVGGTILMMAGMLVAAWLRGIDLGRFWVAAFKLAAIAVAPAAAVTLASPVLAIIPLGGLVGAVGQFGLAFALLGAMFDLDQSDTWYCVCIMFLISVGIFLIAWWV